MQVDWGEATILWSGESVKVNLFCARLCYSCAPIVFAYRRQNLESFLDAITRSIRYFGGTPRQIIFDNARVAVKSGFGAHAVAQDDYAHLAALYGFNVVFCNPASGNEKGLVENLVGYIRRNVCVPLPKVESLDELDAKLLEQCVKYLTHQVEGRPRTAGEMLAEDRVAFYPIPKYEADISKKYYPVVSRFSTVQVDTNLYSVPCTYTGKSTTVKAFPERIEIWCEGKLIASHSRLFGHKQEMLDIRHYLPLLSKKGRAIRNAAPVRQLVPVSFLDWMEAQKLSAREMTDMLEECVNVGWQTVMQRGKAAVHDSAPQEKTASVETEIGVQVADLSVYDSLCGKGASS